MAWWAAGDPTWPARHHTRVGAPPPRGPAAPPVADPAVAWQMAAGVVAAYAGPMDAVHWAPQTVTAAVLDLAGELAEHLGNAADLCQIGDWLEMSARSLSRQPSAVRKILDCQRTREQ